MAVVPAMPRSAEGEARAPRGHGQADRVLLLWHAPTASLDFRRHLLPEVLGTVGQQIVSYAGFPLIAGGLVVGKSQVF